MNEKIIKLDEQEQRDLFCAALHLTNYMEDIKENKVGEFTTACKFCTKYGKECAKLAAEGEFNIYDRLKILTELTGVIFSPAIGTRKLVKENKWQFFK